MMWVVRLVRGCSGKRGGDGGRRLELRPGNMYCLVFASATKPSSWLGGGGGGLEPRGGGAFCT